MREEPRAAKKEGKFTTTVDDDTDEVEEEEVTMVMRVENGMVLTKRVVGTRPTT